jgi:tRNA nucleotidyltransferase/poly(A) polymerase
MAAAAPAVPHSELRTTPKISLTTEEEELFHTLQTFIDENQLQTTIRVAGGWVRDKILSASSSSSSPSKGKKDIDLALENMSGSHFAQLLSEWTHNKTRNSTGTAGDAHVEEPPLRFHVIQFNPNKSKHLETATMRFLNFEIDFCGLRTENYTTDSRVPHLISHGTPSEDAHRRDLTINSLFYNLQTKEIEDLTGNGLQDLFERKISTPLPPLVTLQDDPLRCLRVVRFASRLNFTLTPSLAVACRSSVVHEALTRKVSPERIAQEMNLMIGHPSFGLRALPLLYQLNLLPHILRLPHSHTIYRFYEPEPSNKLNWRYLWVPLRPKPVRERESGTSAETHPEVPMEGRPGPLHAWKISQDAVAPHLRPDPPSSTSPLMQCVETNGRLDPRAMCQSAVALNLLTDYFHLSSENTAADDENDSTNRLLRSGPRLR